LLAGQPLGLVSAFTVDVESGQSACFVLELEKGSSFSGNYEVLTPDLDLSTIDIKVTGPKPHSAEHYASSGGAEEGSFALEAADSGDHTLCLTNTGWSATATLGFAFREDAKDLLANGAEAATEENVKSMIEVANELTQGLDMLADHQEFMRVREDVHRATVSHTNGQVLWWSVAEAAVLAAMALWQVVYIRTFFETKRPI
jgi:hypothetical protein